MGRQQQKVSPIIISNAYRQAARASHLALLDMRLQVRQLRAMERAGRTAYEIQLQGENVDIAMENAKAAHETLRQQSEILHGKKGG